MFRTPSLNSIANTHLFEPSLAPIVVVVLVMTGDMAVLGLMAALTGWLRFGDFGFLNDYLPFLIITTATTMALLRSWGLYSLDRLSVLFLQARGLLAALDMAFMLVAGLIFMTKTGDAYSRLWVGGWFVASLVGMFISRIAWKAGIKRARRKGAFRRNVIVIGTVESSVRLIQYFNRDRVAQLRVVGVVLLSPAEGPDHANATIASEVPVLGHSADDVSAAVHKANIDQIILAMDWENFIAIKEYAKKLETIPVDIQLAPPTTEYAGHQVCYLDDLPMVTLLRRPLSEAALLAKSAIDKVVSLLLLIALSPVLLLAAVAIKLDTRGPILFKQERYGFTNRIFTVYKFRTMHHFRPPEHDVPSAKRDDPRTTRVGRWLRRTSIDELPQLLNVLKGDMSLVGPRPLARAHNEKYLTMVEGYLNRHKVRPGMTGWAQVNGLRGEITDLQGLSDRLAHDIYYVEHWTFGLDLNILARTVLCLWDKNAY